MPADFFWVQTRFAFPVQRAHVRSIVNALSRLVLARRPICRRDCCVVLVLNTLLLSGSVTPVPDIVALGATLTNDGIVNLPGASGAAAFAVATVNVGAAGSIRASADTGNATLPVNLSLCQTNPTTGACLAPPSGSVTTQIDPGATPTFGIFVTGTDNVSFDPATHRVFVRFTDGGGAVRGATSVAVRTQ